MPPGEKTICVNRKARHEYSILETVEAGLVLAGTEVKSLRAGQANIQDAYAKVSGGELWLHNSHISPYEQGNRFNVDPRRDRKLLLHKRELLRLGKMAEEKGLTLVPLRLYFRDGRAKVELGLARGRRLYDKRDTIRDRDLKREMEGGP